jgi:hypothetical protein
MTVHRQGSCLATVDAEVPPTIEVSMKKLPKTENGLVIRTDFSDDSAWEAVRTAIRAAGGELPDFVTYISDPAYQGLTVNQLTELVPEGAEPTYVFMVDHTTLTHPDHPILVVDLYSERGRTFRALPSEMFSIEANLSLANMDFDEFADNVDPDGIFRGFPEA